MPHNFLPQPCSHDIYLHHTDQKPSYVDDPSYYEPYPTPNMSGDYSNVEKYDGSNSMTSDGSYVTKDRGSTSSNGETFHPMQNNMHHQWMSKPAPALSNVLNKKMTMLFRVNHIITFHQPNDSKTCLDQSDIEKMVS